MFEKRKFARYKFTVPLKVWAVSPHLKKEIQYHGETINISRGGMLFASIAVFGEKTDCHVEFPSEHGEQVSRVGSVLRTVPDAPEKKKLPPEMKVYALQFNETMDETELESLLNQVILV